MDMKRCKNPISLEERKAVQLEMLKEIDAFCRTNNIKYSLAFGTLLGAIRHKGFIPWDDDVDIMMPLPDMLRFKELFHSETMKYYDVDTDKDFEYPFSRIANTNTYCKKGIITKTYGICIDLYIVVSIPSEIHNRNLFFQKASKLIRRRFQYMKWNAKVIKLFPIRTIPGFHRAIKEYRDYILNYDDYGRTGLYYIVAGPLSLRDKMTYDFDMFEDMIEVDFENIKFMSIMQYDKFLTMRYGDYMKLPPEDQRHPYHGYYCFWK